MNLKFEIKRTKSIENAAFLIMARIILEFLNVGLRYGRLIASFRFSPWSIVYTLSLIALIYACFSLSETFVSVGVAGVSCVYFIRAVIDLLTALADRNSGAVMPSVMLLYMFAVSVVLLSFMMGKTRRKFIEIFTLVCIGGYAVYIIFAIAKSSGTFFISDLSDIIVIISYAVMIRSMEEK